MFNVEDVIPFIIDGQFNGATEILERMDLKPTSNNYKRLKFLMTYCGCEQQIKNKKRGYLVNERLMRENIAQRVIRLSRR